jgi:glycosyltransferase involved in cell wall biosynthesis
MNNKRLGIVSTHPIQYHGAWFRRLASEPGISIEVLYCHSATAREQGEAGFGVEFDWDISLLDGYPNRFIRNVAKHPGLAGFNGLDTPEIKNIIAEERFDAVMINGWHYKSAWQTMRACWASNTPVMVRSDSHLNTQRSGLKRAGKWPFYRWFISKLDACLPVGKWSADYFLHYGASADRVFVVPHVVDTDYFARQSELLSKQRKNLRAQWALPDDDVVFLFAGKFSEIKRPLDFVRAIGHANSRGSKVSGLMVGDGPLREQCEAEVRTNNLPIKFTGFLNQSRIAEAYVAGDALVMPSTAETWGLVVNEAMAFGLPCMVSDGVGSGPDMVVDGVTGAVFSAGDIEGLSMMLSNLAVNKPQLVSMGNSARAIAQQYTLEVAVTSMVKAMETVTK